MVKKEKYSLKELKHQARTYSIKEGIFASSKTAVGDNFISPLAIAINTSSPMVAMLSSISGLVGPTSQLFGSKLMEKKSRKKITLLSDALRSLFWLSLIVISFLFYKGILTSLLPFLLLAFFAAYTIFVGIAAPAWFSWMGDIVSKKDRGKFFSKRNLILGSVSAIVAIIASFFLDFFKANSWTMFGFMILFALAFIFRLTASRIIKKQYEPKMKLDKGYYFSFWQFLKKAPTNNLGKLSIYRFFLTMANVIASSLLAVYLLRHLGFSYITYMLVTIIGHGATFLVLELWGKFSDKYGNYRAIELSSVLLIVVPILWIINPSPIYLLLIPASISAIAWSGFHLAETNFIYDNVSPQKRGLAISYYNMFWGVGIFLGAGISALLIKYLTISIIAPIVAIFLLSAFLRMIVVIIGIRKIREIRHTSKFEGIQSIEDLLMKEGKSTVQQEFNDLMHIGKYLKAK